ncbi:hypothetical protein NQ317_000153 [Molorchus minor]|uniref:Uncharacterized protein n=1 Tax=Molorchus minor TaxID=1323400 RepID=A0ABQ9JFM0_9CUCU|nr:hypothetical protein NQ317_000153 [Molorchus minor]
MVLIHILLVLYQLQCIQFFGRGEKYSIVPFRMFFTVWNVLINFYLSHFEKYNTGVLFLPWGYDFSMWGTILTFLLAGLVVTNFGNFGLQNGLTTGMMFEILLYVSSLISNIPVVFYNIYNSYKYRTGHMRPFTEAIRPLVPLAIFFVITLIWVLKSPANIVEKDPRALFFLMGTIFSNISSRLIVAQMSNTRCDAFNSLLIPIIAVLAISIGTQSALLELYLTYCLCLTATLAHIHYGTCVVRQMCHHFKVNCFTIKKESD